MTRLLLRETRSWARYRTSQGPNGHGYVIPRLSRHVKVDIGDFVDIAVTNRKPADGGLSRIRSAPTRIVTWRFTI
jgi:hypothetical protein